jgi:hypothetical protein
MILIGQIKKNVSKSSFRYGLRDSSSAKRGIRKVVFISRELEVQGNMGLSKSYK